MIKLAENKAFIPLYLNDEIVNNLFTIVVQEFVEAKSVSIKEQVTISYKVPMSEFSYELFGKYIQGDINVQVVNESSKQKTNAAVSKNIEIFMSLRELLFKNKLLRYIDNDELINNIHENDFIIINCRLMKNPIFSYIENVINKIEIQSILSDVREDNIKDNHLEVLKRLYSQMNELKNSGCIRYLTNELCNPKSRFVVPIEQKHSIANMHYIIGGKVNVMGKVINTIDTSDMEYAHILGDKLLDFINEDYSSDFADKYLNIRPVVKSANSRFTTDNNKILEILPIAIFL